MSLSKRAQQRRNGQRGGDVAALVHGPHDRAWLYSGVLNASGQARVDHKRSRRAEFWRTVRVRVSAELEGRFRATIGILGREARVHGAGVPVGPEGLAVDLRVHVPGAPVDAESAEVIYRSVPDGNGRHTMALDHLVWRRADGSLITESGGN